VREQIGILRDVIILNEVGNDLDLALEFSDPDGVRSGKSGWSFGAVQFDTQNNEQAILCLKECGFTTEEIKGLVEQTIDVRPLNQRLKDHADIIAKYDNRQLQHCLKSALQFTSTYNIPIAETSTIISLADTFNQYGSLGGKTAKRFTTLERPVTAQDMLDIKLTWKYAKRGKRQRKDTIRRHNNIMAVMGKEVA